MNRAPRQKYKILHIFINKKKCVSFFLLGFHKMYRTGLAECVHKKGLNTYQQPCFKQYLWCINVGE